MGELIRVLGAVALILLGFSAFFLTFLLAPFLVLLVFYFVIDGADRRKKKEKQRQQAISEAEEAERERRSTSNGHAAVPAQGAYAAGERA